MFLEFTFDPILDIESKETLNKFKNDPIKFFRINWSYLSGGVDRNLLKTSRSHFLAQPPTSQVAEMLMVLRVGSQRGPVSASAHTQIDGPTDWLSERLTIICR